MQAVCANKTCKLDSHSLLLNLLNDEPKINNVINLSFPKHQSDIFASINMMNIKYSWKRFGMSFLWMMQKINQLTSCLISTLANPHTAKARWG